MVEGGKDECGDDDELRQLEESVLADLAAQQAAMDLETPSPSPLQFSPVAAEHSEKQQPVGSGGVTGSVAAGLSPQGDGSFTLEQLQDPQVEQLVRARFEKMDETNLAKELSMAKFHPEFEPYCKAVYEEVGEGEWEFGEHEPFEDLVGLNVWSICKQRFRDRLALGEVFTATPAPPPPTAMPPQAAPAPAKASPAAMPPPSKALPTAATPPQAAPAPATALPTASITPQAAPAPAKALPTTPAAMPAQATPVTEPTQPAVKAPASILRRPHITWDENMTSHPPPPNTPEPKAPSTAATPPPPKAPALPPSELSQHVDEVSSGVALPNSVSNRAEYMAFLRAARNPKKMCKSLIPTFMSGDKLDLFRIWLEKGQDFAKVEIEVNRRNIQSTRAEAKDLCLSKAQLAATPGYTATDVDDLIRRKTLAGEYIDDPNFPGREDLRQYIVRAETSSTAARTREDVQQVNSTTQATPAEALSLTEPGCDFANEGPTIHSLGADLTGATAPSSDQTQGPGKAKGKGRAKAKAKGQSKGTKGTGGEGDHDNQPPPDKIPEPLAKANQLKVKVFLDSQKPQDSF